MLRQFRAAQLPVVASGWIEDIHDPHNWVQPFTYGTYGGRQGLPADIIAKYQELAGAAVRESDPAKREQMYFDIQKEFHNDVISVTLAQATGPRFEQRWLNGYYYRVGQFQPFRYAMSQN